MVNFLYFWAKFLTKMTPTALKNCKISKTSKVGHGSNFINVNVGKYTYFGNYNSLNNVDIGSFCSISSYCAIGGGTHEIDYVSTSPVFFKGKNVLRKNIAFREKVDDKKVIIGNDVWIGEKVFIKPGITIGDGAVIGAHSVVTKNVEPYSVVAGSPAKLIKYRFSPAIIQNLLSIKWWELSDEKISSAARNTDDVEIFIKKIREEENE